MSSRFWKFFCCFFAGNYFLNKAGERERWNWIKTVKFQAIKRNNKLLFYDRQPGGALEWRQGLSMDVVQVSAAEALNNNNNNNNSCECFVTKEDCSVVVLYLLWTERMPIRSRAGERIWTVVSYYCNFTSRCNDGWWMLILQRSLCKWAPIYKVIIL